MLHHTAGPWKASDKQVFSGEFVIAEACGGDDDIDRANARLMAATLDLLAVCEFAYAHCNPTAGRELEWDRLIANAMAKAGV